MAAGLIVPVSGPYSGYWDKKYLGVQNDDGFVLSGSYQGQEINMSDAYGMTLTEAIYRGLNWRLRFRSLEFGSPGVLQLIQAFGSIGLANSTFTPALAHVGDRFTKFSKLLLLEAILDAPPTIPQTLSSLSAVVAPQSNVEYLMTSKAREAPFEMVLFPYKLNTLAATVYNVSFTTT